METLVVSFWTLHFTSALCQPVKLSHWTTCKVQKWPAFKKVSFCLPYRKYVCVDCHTKEEYKKKASYSIPVFTILHDYQPKNTFIALTTLTGITVSNRSPVLQQDVATSQSRSDYYHCRPRRCHSTLWDVHNSPCFGQPLHESALFVNTHHTVPNSARLYGAQLRLRDTISVHIPGPNKEINLPALLALLQPSSSATPSSPSNIYSLSEAQAQVIVSKVLYYEPYIPSSVLLYSVSINGHNANDKSQTLSIPNSTANVGDNSITKHY